MDLWMVLKVTCIGTLFLQKTMESSDVPTIVPWKPEPDTRVNEVYMNPIPEIDKLLAFAPPIPSSTKYEERCVKAEEHAFLHMEVYINRLLKFDEPFRFITNDNPKNVERLGGKQMFLVSQHFLSWAFPETVCCSTVVKMKTFLKQVYFYCGWTKCYPGTEFTTFKKEGEDSIRCYFPDANYDRITDKDFQQCLITKSIEPEE